MLGRVAGHMLVTVWLAGGRRARRLVRRMADDLDRKVRELCGLLHQMERVLVCFSGGVDSSYVLAESVATLGERATALTAVSPSLAAEEGAAAKRLAAELGARHLLLETHEVDDPRYAANPVNRCYFCKTEVYGRANQEARRLGIPYVLDGFNVDDRGDHRPGRKAAREHGVRSPLDEVGLTKADVREAARRINLRVWDKPALACLSSRFPYGVAITPERLTQVATCERVLQQLGFRVCRVRFHEALARIEVPREDVPRLLTPDVRDVVVKKFRAAGFSYVTIDMEGYRTGSLNRVAPVPARLVNAGQRPPTRAMPDKGGENDEYRTDDGVDHYRSLDRRGVTG